MNFEFNEDQLMLRGLIREFLTEQCPVSHVREMIDSETGYDKNIYRSFVQLGIVPFSEKYGGGELGMVEQAIIHDEMGRIPYAGPWFSTVTLAGTAIMASGDEAAMIRYLPDVSNGDLTMTLAFTEADIGWSPDSISLTIAGDGDEVVLNGEKRFVPYGENADVILVVGRKPGTSGPEGLSIVAVPADTNGVSSTREQVLDQTSRSATLKFEDVRVSMDNMLGAEGSGWTTMEQVIQRAAVAASAEMVGASRRSLDMSVEYAKVRQQFGQYIGQFQAVKHKLSEMLEKVENAHAAAYYAAWAIDADAYDKALACSVAKSNVNEYSKSICGEAIQVHGGIGFTWEYDLHFYFKRAKYYEPLFGDTEFHREIALNEVLAGRTAAAAS